MKKYGKHCQARSPAFLERLHKITNGEVPEKRAVWELFFAIVSEMLITSTLRDARDHPKIDNGIILMIDDHAVMKQGIMYSTKEFLR